MMQDVILELMHVKSQLDSLGFPHNTLIRLRTSAQYLSS